MSPDEAAHLLEHGSRSNSASSSDLVKRAAQEQHVLSNDASDVGAQDTFERMMLEGRPYLCRIPHVLPETEDNSTSDAQQAEQQQELIRASDSGWKLLAGMEGNCLYSGTGWWMYSFCYGQDVLQFHPLPPMRGQPLYPPTPDPHVYNFTLGRFKRDDDKKANELGSGDGESTTSDTSVSTELQTRGESNFLVQKLGGGTTCDLTGEERQIEIQYHCNPNFNDRISLIKEVATCSYQMVVHTPRLCNEAAFLPPQTSKPNTIACREILGKDEEADWKKGKAAQASFELFQAQQDQAGVQDGQSRKRPVVGGIELGGQKLVGGSPERTIKASKLAQPPKMQPKEEKYIATLASSDGKQTTIMNEREIRRHELTHSLDQIEDYILQTEEWAENVRPGQPWKLDVVQTANGMEYRGILIANDGEEEEEQSKATDISDGAQEGSQEEYKQPEKKP